MKRGKISKADFGKLLVAVSKTATLLGPTPDRTGVKLAELEPSMETSIILDYDNFGLPPKLWFFPRSEVIATGDSSLLQAAPLAGTPTVLFGLRPCDAAALEYLDKIFLDEAYLDPYYKDSRANTAIVALA